MNVTFTLTGGSASTAAGPFNISGTTSGDVTSQLATGITKSQLLTGYTINSVNDAITGGTIASTGTCSTTTNWSVTPTSSLGVLVDNSFILGLTESSTCPGTNVYNAVYMSQFDYDNRYTASAVKLITLYQDEQLSILYTGYNFVYVEGYLGGLSEVYSISPSTAVIGNPAGSQPC
jgi:hypothetical protein